MKERSENSTACVEHSSSGVSWENCREVGMSSFASKNDCSEFSRTMLNASAACSPAFPVIAFSAIALPRPQKAAKREEEGVSEVKQTFEREQSTMRAEVDRELGKINDLYHERCRDYAQMVTEECEDEVSKTSAGKEPAAAFSLGN